MNPINGIHLSGKGMSAGSEILVQMSDHRLKVGEIPIEVRYDIDGTSSQNPIRHGVTVLMNVMGMLPLGMSPILFSIRRVLGGNR